MQNKDPETLKAEAEFIALRTLIDAMNCQNLGVKTKVKAASHILNYIADLKISEQGPPRENWES